MFRLFFNALLYCYNGWMNGNQIFFIYYYYNRIVEMAELVKIKGLKGKQNKKKWAKNIDVSLLLQAQARDHDEDIRSKFRSNLLI